MDWRTHGVRVVHADELDPNTPQTPGMSRMAAIDTARAGAEKLWAGTVVIHPDAKTGAHHHGHLESVIYVVEGRARMRWGERLEFIAEAGPGDFIYVPPYVPHQEINANPDAPLSCVVVRSDQEAVVVNLTCRTSSRTPSACAGWTTSTRAHSLRPRRPELRCRGRPRRRRARRRAPRPSRWRCCRPPAASANAPSSSPPRPGGQRRSPPA